MAITLGAAKGIILKLNRTMLVENSGHVDLNKAWARGQMGFVKRKGTTSKSKNLVENFEELKASFYGAGVDNSDYGGDTTRANSELGSNWSQFDSIILLDYGAERSQVRVLKSLA